MWSVVRFNSIFSEWIGTGDEMRQRTVVGRLECLRSSLVMLYRSERMPTSGGAYATSVTAEISPRQPIEVSKEQQAHLPEDLNLGHVIDAPARLVLDGIVVEITGNDRRSSQKKTAIAKNYSVK